MIDEQHQDLAAEYVLDALDPAAARAFEAELAADPELRAFTTELREAAAALAHSAPHKLPPPELRELVLSGIRHDGKGASAPVQTGGYGVLPWILAAGFAITTAALWFERNTLSRETESLIAEASELRNRDALAKVRIVPLTAQVDAYAKSSVIIVWDPQQQRGIVKLANFPPAENGKDYQLWVIDPKYPNPVNGGVLPVGEDGTARVSFVPDQPVRKVEKFAISVEPAGGVQRATGPIVLLGN